MSSHSTTSGPLSHVTVLDLTQFLAGPYGTQILGDLGAQVIKIEPLEGDITRRMPPHYHEGESAYFLSVNRNKKSFAVDLKDPRGRSLVLELAKKADVVIESFRPGVAQRLGIDFESLRAVNPHIVMCSISGFGQDGPYHDLPAYDIIIQAISGGMSLTGEVDGKPVRAGIPLADLCAGMFAVIGALSGLAKVGATGEGAYFDISMMDCQVSMLSYQAVYYLMSGEVPGLQGRGHRSLATYRAFMCGDGIEIVVAANTEKMWASLCEVLDLAELVSDPRFCNREGRLKNRAELDSILEAAFAQRTSEELLPRLQELTVPAAPINTLDRVFADPHVKFRKMVTDLIDSKGGRVQVVANPVRVPACEHTPSFPPKLGADNLEILQEILNLSRDEMRELAETKVVAPLVGHHP